MDRPCVVCKMLPQMGVWNDRTEAQGYFLECPKCETFAHCVFRLICNKAAALRIIWS